MKINLLAQKFGAAMATVLFIMLTFSAKGQTSGNYNGFVWVTYGSGYEVLINGYTGPGGDIVIPAFINTYPVTKIGLPFVSDSTKSTITGLTIPDSIYPIDISFFEDCTGLRNVTIGNRLITIEENAFDFCGMTNVTILGSVTLKEELTGSAEGYAFANCTNLTSIAVSSGLTNIPPHTFDNCTSLINVTLPNSVKSIEESAFASCSGLTRFVIPNSVTNIGGGAFGFCTNLANIAIPNSVVSLGDQVFFDCSSLTNVTIGTNVTSIAGAFELCSSLANLTIPNSVTNISSAFMSCTSLTNINIPSSVTDIGQYAFEGCSSLSSVTMTNSVTSVEAQAFGYCSSLTNIIFPSSVTNMGSDIFDGCTSLHSFTIPNGVTDVGEEIFWDCTSLTNVVIPDSVASIGANAFYNCSSLANVTLPSKITDIGNAVFEGCTSLSSITIPKGVTNIEYWAFAECTNLTGVYFLGNAPTNVDLSVILSAFDGDNNAAIYYLPGATGWGTNFGGHPTALWKPQVQSSDASLGIRTNRFGFNITWASGQAVVVEACTNLSKAKWSPVATNSLTSSQMYFSDSKWTNYSGRFYRVRSQ